MPAVWDSKERFNQTLLSLLGTLELEQQSKWVEYLPALIQAYNNSIHSTTGYAPSYLMFGRHVRLPLDLIMGTAPADEARSDTEWVGQHHQCLSYAYKKVSERLGNVAKRNKHLYDRTAHDSPLLPGERVLIRDSRRQGKDKLSDCWESQPYVVVSSKPNLPVYTIRPEERSGPDMVLHRNLLRPCPNYPVVVGGTPIRPETAPVQAMGCARAQLRRLQREGRGRPPVMYGDWASS